MGIRAASRQDGREGSEEASESIVVRGSSIAWRRVLYEKQEVYGDSVQVHHNTSGAPQSLNPHLSNAPRFYNNYLILFTAQYHATNQETQREA